MSQERVQLFFDKNVFSKSALIRTGYHLADKLDIELTNSPEAWVCYLSVLKDTGEQPDVLFRRAALDFMLREQIETKTGAIKEKLISAALAEALPRQP